MEKGELGLGCSLGFGLAVGLDVWMSSVAVRGDMRL